MKKICIFLALFVLAGCDLAPINPGAPTPMATLTNPWLGQTPPDATPRTFASGSYHSSPTFSPDGRIAYWGGEYSTAKIYTSRLDGETWTPPAIINFSEDMNSYRDPFISPDGQRLYFISEEPIPGSSAPIKENIWVMEKEGDGWGAPQPLPDSVNVLPLHWTVSVASNYNLYYAAGPIGVSDIYLSRYIDGEYAEAILLDKPVNSEGLEFTPNIAPDESYLLFSRMDKRNSTPYLFISYALDSGWSEPQRIENIKYGISPIVTPDRNYVIYLSSPYTFEWRDTSFVEELRP
jgi:Tol biopolymer transport system component